MSEVSNIRKRKRIDPTSQEFDPEEEIVQAALEGRRPRLFPNAQEGPEAYTSEERIWVEYGIKPTLPTRIKVEQLFVSYRLSARDIADVVGITESEVELHMKELNVEWQNLGKALSPEEREIARGHMVSELLRLKDEIVDAMTGASSADKARMLTLRMNIVTQLTQLRGLSLDKKELARPEDEEEADPIEKRIKELSNDKQKELHDRLRAAATHRSL
jgi:hypothetical protein